MNKSRFVLLGAFVSLLSLAGCGTVSSMVDAGKAWTAKLTGADDPNNQSLMATAGRANIAGIDAAADVAGVRSQASPSPAPAAETPPPAPSPAAVVVSPAPVAASASAKKVAAKKLPPKGDPKVKTVAATTTDTRSPKAGPDKQQ